RAPPPHGRPAGAGARSLRRFGDLEVARRSEAGQPAGDAVGPAAGVVGPLLAGDRRTHGDAAGVAGRLWREPGVAVRDEAAGRPLVVEAAGERRQDAPADVGRA